MQKYYYKTIIQQNKHTIPKIKWSKFIWNIFHIKTKKDAEKYIKEIKQKYKDARHNCYGYICWTKINFDLFWQLEITPEQKKESDDGEPTNTGWKTILAQIQWHNLYNVLIIVTRYFWWTLLWVWWLIQAYSECAKQTILNSKIEEVEITQNMTISFDYKNISTIMNWLNKYDAKITNENHGEKAEISFEINKWYIKSFKESLWILVEYKQ